MGKHSRLSATFVQGVNQPGRYGDGRGSHGLSLLVKPSTVSGWSKSWSQRLRVDSKVSQLGLGAYPVVSLAQAREQALENAKSAVQGINPRKTAPTSAPLFSDASETVIDIHSGTWRDGGKSARQWRASLATYALPALGDLPIDKIESADVLAVLTPIWTSKPETARRVRQRVSAVLRWGIAAGHRRDDAASVAILEALPRTTGSRKHQRAIHHKDVGAALDVVQASGAFLTTKAALRFLVLTAARSGEVRGAAWSEVDDKLGVWTIPASRMKAGVEHRVPLSPAALAVLAEARKLPPAPGGRGLVFPSQTGKQVSDNTLSKLLRENGVDAVVHGFRSSFRDWCGDTGQPREVAEMALAHVVKGVEAAYARSDLFARRRLLMDSWSRYVTNMPYP